MAFSAVSIFNESPLPLFLKASDREDAIRQVVFAWKDHPAVPGPVESILQAVLEREALMSTALPNGIAFPHARTGLVTAPVVAFGRLDAPVKFGEVPVWLIIAVATPPQQTMDHLQLLSWLTRRCANSAVPGLLREAPTPEEFRAAFAG
ncbi:MAG TPA: PTS sugar transporter subunit IIA [Verrucomicrobiales bacterium]|nr:PTS sugar transporter subunit IIA [Verrucomicrobiales bacterium]